MKKKLLGALVLAGAVAVPAAGAVAAEQRLPKQIAWTAYDSGSSGYAQSVGIGAMLKKRYEADLRIIPGKNDVSRMLPLRAGQADLCACGIASYFSQEGVLMFAEKTWGPQRIFNLFNNIGRNGQQLATAADAEIKTPADLKGKRVTFVRGAPALNVNATAFLAFGGLTWDDVQKVEVPGWSQSVDAVINGQADAVWGSTISSQYNQLAASPRGLYFPRLPHDDKEGWERAKKIAPWWTPKEVTLAVGTEEPYEGTTFPYPIFVARPQASDDLTYGLTKAVMENYADLEGAGPGMDGYKLENQSLSWVFPYAPGAIEYYKEKGLWNAEHQASTDAALKRQDALAEAWKTFMAKDVGEDEFVAEWHKIRAEALDGIGQDVPFREPLS